MAQGDRSWSRPGRTWVWVRFGALGYVMESGLCGMTAHTQVVGVRSRFVV